MTSDLHTLHHDLDGLSDRDVAGALKVRLRFRRLRAVRDVAARLGMVIIEERSDEIYPDCFAIWSVDDARKVAGDLTLAEVEAWVGRRADVCGPVVV